MNGYPATSVATILLVLTAASTVVARQAIQADVVTARARDLHTRAIVIDAHDDTTQRMLFDKSFDVGVRNNTGSIDIFPVRPSTVPLITPEKLDAASVEARYS